MDPTTATSAVLRSAGKIGAAAVSHYRPVGVARVGSAEDRVQAYRRLIDATVQYRLALSFADATKSSASASHPLGAETVRHLMITGAELVCALQGVQLCAPGYVIMVAQDAVAATKDTSESDDAAYRRAQAVFLNAARHDLNYNPKRWQFWAKRKVKNFNPHRLALSSDSKE